MNEDNIAKLVIIKGVDKVLAMQHLTINVYTHYGSAFIIEFQKCQ